MRVVEEPEPIYKERLSYGKMVELEARIYKVLREGNSTKSDEKILNLSDRDIAKMLQKMDELENSDIFLLQPLIDEKKELTIELDKLELSLQGGISTDSEREVFEQLQSEIEIYTR